MMVLFLHNFSSGQEKGKNKENDSQWYKWMAFNLTKIVSISGTEDFLTKKERTAKTSGTLVCTKLSIVLYICFYT